MEIVNQKVIHKKFGEGIITWFGGKPQNKNKYIRVDFTEKSIELQYPSAFKTFLNAIDPEFEKAINIELKNLDEEDRERKKVSELVSAPVKNVPPSSAIDKKIKSASYGCGNVLGIGNSFGTNSRVAYMKCCNLFGWDKSEANNFGRQGALLYAKRATPEGFSPWFVSNHNLEKTKSKKWSNTIDGDFIYEEWNEIDNRLWEDKTVRVVFLKLHGNYHFFGLYQVDNIELKANGKYTKTYRRISKEYSNQFPFQPYTKTY